jgi:hypothetical protein
VINNLEELLTKSRQLNSSKCVRLIDQQIESLSTKKNQSIESLILSCNKLGKSEEMNWKQLPNHLQVFLFDFKNKNKIKFSIWNYHRILFHRSIKLKMIKIN